MNVFDQCLNSVWPKVSTILFGQHSLSLDDSYMEQKTLFRVNQAKEKARPGEVNLTLLPTYVVCSLLAS